MDKQIDTLHYCIWLEKKDLHDIPFYTGYEMVQHMQAGQKKKQKQMTETREIVEDITEEPVLETLVIATKTGSGRSVKPKLVWSPSRPEPSTIIIQNDDNQNQSQSDDDDEDSEPCCVCQQHSPPALQTCTNLTIVNWAKCSVHGCGHWVHLRFCHTKTSVARNRKFFCPCCENTQSEQ